MVWGLLMMFLGMAMLESDGVWFYIAVAIFIAGAGLTMFYNNRCRK